MFTVVCTHILCSYKIAYDAGDSPVTDFEYDKLFEELIKLEEQFPIDKTNFSHTKSWKQGKS